jgi:hypothetical protein
MNTNDKQSHRRRRWRLTVLLLVVFPFLPEILVSVVAAVAITKGCPIDAKTACVLLGVPVSRVISYLLTAGLFVAGGFVGLGLAAPWLVMCYFYITRGWAGLVARLALALSVTLIFALLPYLAPALAIAPLINAHCQPNEGGVGRCLMFGGDVSGAHETIVLPWLITAGVPIAFGTAAVYAIVAAVVRSRAAKRSAQRPQ